jgi:hypothetical protein
MMEWIIPIVAVLGVGGTIAAAVLFPAVVIPVLQSVMRCKPCLYALVIIAALVGSWWHGNHTAVVACQEAEMAAGIRNHKLDMENERQAKADAERQIKAIEDSANERAKTDAEYIERLKAKPACLLDDDDIGLPAHRPGSKNAPQRAK